MIRSAIKTLLVLAFLLWNAPAMHCQQEEKPSPKLDVRSLAEAAVARLKAASDSQTRFTDFKLDHTFNFDEKGKKIFELHELVEETWINNLPYQKLIEKNGKPLEGRKLREEQKRYDEAVAGHRALGDEERSRIEKLRLVSTDSSPNKALGPGYTLREIRQEPSPHGLLHVIEATNRQPTLDQCRWRYRLWISEDGPTLFRYVADVADNPELWFFCKGAIVDISWDLVDGIPKVVHEQARFHVLRRDGLLTIEGEKIYSRYRRFSTTVTLGPASLNPEESEPNPKKP